MRVKINRILGIFLILFCSNATYANRNTGYQTVSDYVDHLVKEASSVLHSNALTEDQKSSKSEELLAENLDLEWMAKYTLGRSKRVLTEDQINEFVKLYSHYMISTYSSLVKSYKGQQTEVIKVLPIDTGEFIVNTKVLGANGSPQIKVDYLVRKIKDYGDKDLFKISDIITEGVSMIDSQRSEFSGLIVSNGFDFLLETLKKKI